MTRLQFLGAARQVTGSCYLLETAGKRILIDCGLFQERKFLERNWAPFAFDPRTIDVMLLTHGHLDHCGLIPKLVAGGYSGRIYTTAPSVDIADIVMRDSGKIHEEDAGYKAKRHAKEGRKSPHEDQPLYTVDDAQRVTPLLEPVRYGEPVRIADGKLIVTFHDAGHILGSAMLKIELRDGDKTRRILFSGDIGQWNKPLIGDPTVFSQADYVVMESTYGDREHEEEGPVEDRLADIINQAARDGGKVVIPTFAIERAQELIWHLSRLLAAKKIKPLPVFLDSPMAGRVNQVFDRFRDYLDAAAQKTINAGGDPIDFPGLKLTGSVEDSKAINDVQGPAVIMAGSGMCTGGRIKHHLKQTISNPRNTLLFVGYQSPDTLGGLILSGREEVRIHGEFQKVQAKIRQLHGMSAHADHSDLLRWLGGLNTPPKKLFLTHGEEGVALKLADEIGKKPGWNVTVPHYQEAIELA